MSGKTSPTHFSSRDVADTIRKEILAGRWPAGSRLPASRTLAENFDISLNTAQSALRQLEAQDLITCKPRVGAFVKQEDMPKNSPKAKRATDIGIIRAVDLEEIAGDTSQFLPATNWTSNIIQQIEKTAIGANLNLSLISYNISDTDPLDQIVQRIEELASSLAGIICFDVRPLASRLMDQLDNRDIPWVTINSIHKRSVHNFVTSDNTDASYALGRVCAELRYDRIFLLNTSLDWIPQGDKVHGFLDGCLTGGLPLRHIDYLDCKYGTESCGYSTTTQAIAKFGPPKFIFAMTDGLAIGAMNACREAGLSIPRDVGVVGGTGLEKSEFCTPKLTVLMQPTHDLGEHAAQMLLEMISEGTRRMVGRRIPSTLVIRESFNAVNEVPKDTGWKASS